MARYQIKIAYDGTAFYGFQRQAQTRTVQYVIEQALQRLGWQGDSLLAAGRTDTGVHASGQVIAFDLAWSHAPETLLRALNAHLPVDVAALAVATVPADFHPRYAAQSRSYEYRIFFSDTRHPLRERYAWRVHPPAQIDLLHQTAAALQGTHDFAAFGSPMQPGGSTVRHVFAARWFARHDEWIFAVTGNAFLYHMVRRMVAAQIQVAQGFITPEQFLQALHHPAPQPLQGLAPAHGLCLTEVTYAHALTVFEP